MLGKKGPSMGMGNFIYIYLNIYIYIYIFIYLLKIRKSLNILIFNNNIIIIKLR